MRILAIAPLAAIGLLGCLAVPSTSHDIEPAALLNAVGFSSRASWPSTVLHLDGSEIGATHRLTTVLRRADGVSIRHPEGIGWGLSLSNGNGAGECPVGVYVNGSRVERIQRPGSDLELDGLVSARSILGLELHAGSTGPVRASGDCGTLLIWIPDRMQTSVPFQGRVIARVEGSRADSVTSVTLHPGRKEPIYRQGQYVFSVLPGAYSIVFATKEGEVETLATRVYAHHESRVNLSIN